MSVTLGFLFCFFWAISVILGISRRNWRNSMKTLVTLQELRQMVGWGQHYRKDEALTRACMKNKYLGIGFSPGIRTDKEIARILSILKPRGDWRF